ncbi:hypothetical protein [Rhizobium sp. No.120]
MTVAELRKALEGLPDDMPIAMTNAQLAAGVAALRMMRKKHGDQLGDGALVSVIYHDMFEAISIPSKSAFS